MGYNANNGRLFVILRLDFHGNTPLYIKIRNQVMLAIAKGEPTAGKGLAAIQTLSDETGINMMTICKAYPLLQTEGYVHTDRRRSTAVAISEQYAEPWEKALQPLPL